MGARSDLVNIMKTPRYRWWKYSINHNSGSARWHYIYADEGYARELAEEHFDRNMPDSAKWRGYEFGKASYVPAKVKKAFRAEMEGRACRNAAADLLAAGKAVFDTPGNDAFSMLKKAVDKATDVKPTAWFSY